MPEYGVRMIGMRRVMRVPHPLTFVEPMSADVCDMGSKPEAVAQILFGEVE